MTYNKTHFHSIFMKIQKYCWFIFNVTTITRTFEIKYSYWFSLISSIILNKFKAILCAFNRNIRCASRIKFHLRNEKIYQNKHIFNILDGIFNIM